MRYGCKERSDMFKHKGLQYADMEGLKFNIDFNYDSYKYEPFSSCKGYNGNTIIIRGTDDKLVSDEICKKYLECYNPDKSSYVEIESGDHNFANLKSKQGCEDAIIDFCNKVRNI